MKHILFALLLLNCNVCFAQISEEGTVSKHHAKNRASYQCMNWSGSGVMVIDKRSDRATFLNGWLKFDKRAKINSYLYMDAGRYCVGDSLLFKKTFGTWAKIKKIDIR